MDELYVERLEVLRDWQADIQGESHALHMALDASGSHREGSRAINQRLLTLHKRLLAIKRLIASVEKEGH